MPTVISTGTSARSAVAGTFDGLEPRLAPVRVDLARAEPAPAAVVAAADGAVDAGVAAVSAVRRVARGINTGVRAPDGSGDCR